MPYLLIKASFTVFIPEAAFRASVLEGFVPLLLVWSRRISIGMRGVPLQFRHLLLPGVFLSFFVAGKARFEALSSTVFLLGNSPYEKKHWVAQVDPNICCVYKYLSLFSETQKLP